MMARDVVEYEQEKEIKITQSGCRCIWFACKCFTDQQFMAFSEHLFVQRASCGEPRTI